MNRTTPSNPPSNSRDHLRKQIERCDAEIDRAETLLRAGHSDIDGLTLALADWSQEKRLLQKQLAEQ